MLNGLDLFSGIGGLTLALSGYASPLAYCENDRYAQAVLLQRMRDGELPYGPIWDDIKTLKGEMLPPIDIIWGGFPCQDISCVGARKGLGAERSGLFFEIKRLTNELRPSFVFLENVPAIKKFVPLIRSEFEGLGYDCRDGFIQAGDIGAKMRKNQRWFLLAKAAGKRSIFPSSKSVVGTSSLEKEWREKTAGYNNASNSSNWETRANKTYRNFDGTEAGVDRLRGLGNAVVPLQAREAFKKLMGII